MQYLCACLYQKCYFCANLWIFKCGKAILYILMREWVHTRLSFLYALITDETCASIHIVINFRCCGILWWSDWEELTMFHFCEGLYSSWNCSPPWYCALRKRRISVGPRRVLHKDSWVLTIGIFYVYFWEDGRFVNTWQVLWSCLFCKYRNNAQFCNNMGVLLR